MGDLEEEVAEEANAIQPNFCSLADDSCYFIFFHTKLWNGSKGFWLYGKKMGGPLKSLGLKVHCTCVLTCSMKGILQLCLAGSIPAEKGVEQTLLFTDQSPIFVKAARVFSAVGLFVTKMQSSRSDQTIDVLSSRQNYSKQKNGCFFFLLSLFLF